MKINKLTAALVALGVISLASAAQAANPIIYLTGSTAARSTIDAAMQASGQVFDTGHSGTVKVGSASSGYVVYEGPINGVTVDIDCSWTGSEAGIAAVAGQGLSQNVNGGTYALPGVPPKFYDLSNTGEGPVLLSQIAGAPANPDLSMADTSQAVSQTPESLYPLVDYGTVGIITFSLMKGYEATPDQAWNDLNNVTTAEINQNLAGPLNANFYTGVAADSSDLTLICGRNLGSGTRANALLNFEYGINTTVDQFAYDADYPSGSPGTLTFEGNYAAGQSIVEVFNDGFDSGGSVAKVLDVDGTGSGIVLIGYLGVSDAKSAYLHASGGGAAAYLSYNGVWESDAGVINGNYTYWGQEHLLGSIGQLPGSQAGQVASAIKKGIAAQLTSSNAGLQTGDVRSNQSQSAVIPLSLMQAKRSADGGFPSQGTY